MTYERKDNKRKNAIVGIVSTAIAIAALIIIISVIGDPTGNTGSSQHTAVGAGSGETAQTVSTQETTSEKTDGAESDESTESTQDTDSETDNADKKKTNPKGLEDAIDTEREAEKKVYLSFDDGPSVHTNEILDILKENNIKATFFNVATDKEELLAAERRAYDEGHTMAIHTLTHEYDQVYASFEAWKKDVLAEQSHLEDNLGIITKYYRFPGGSSTRMGKKYGTEIKDCIEWLDENGFKYYDWNVTSLDADGNTYTKAQITDNIVEAIEGMPGEDSFMVLMHDAKPKDSTVEALPKVIEILKNKGYTFCQITDNSPVFHHKKLFEGEVD